jgi:Flp pilus assembly protein TadD
MKRLILALGAATALFALVYGCLFGWSHFRTYQENRGLRQARRFLAAGDLSNASVSARRVLQLNPNCVEGCRIMADLAEFAHSPAAVDWRQRVAELEPSLENRLKLAATALRLLHPPYSLAAQALRDLEPSARELPSFQVLSAELALKLNRVSEAAAHFEEAARLEPNNALHRFNLAVLELQSTNHNAVAIARFALERLSTNHNLAPLALRWRVAQSVRQRTLAEAEGLSLRLLADPRAGLEDRLQHLNILQLSHSPEFTNFLQSVQRSAVTNAVELYSTSEWMGSHGLANEATAWLESFDPKLRETQPIPLAMANLYLINENWAAVQALLQQQQWPDLDFLRLAFLARAAWGQQQTLAAEAQWRGAVRATHGRRGPLTLLLSLAMEWERDTEDLLWQIGQRFPREQWALVELEKRYLAAGNTRGLNKVYAALIGSRWTQDDCTNRNNFATSSMLLKVDLSKAHEIARDLYRHLPNDAVIASTYAYSLHLQGRTQDGLAAFRSIKPESLATPSVALYYGVLLSASGDCEQARRYLAQAQNVPLLPEERELLQSAQTRCR